MSAILKQPALHFRPMLAADLEEIMAIERRSYPYPWTHLIFNDCLRAGYCCWVCERQGVIEGYGVTSVAAGESHLLNLCVRPESLQQGIGRKLLLRLISLARRQNAEMMFLEVRPTNRAARALYESMGFNELGSRRGYYPADHGREDALILARVL
jgi:ribosomal-protein-alanine N-acetyltransferase